MEEIRPGDYLIGADKGAEFLVAHGFRPDLSLGDFDSVAADRIPAIREASGQFQSFDAVRKDWTDTEIAFNEAISRGFTHIAIVGGLGSRFDHALANVHLLFKALTHGCEATLTDDHNEIRLCSGECKLQADSRYPYVSLLPLTPSVTGISLTGFRYPLENATISIGESIGISNVLIEPAGTIRLASGILLVIRSRD
jgi:thiamine pyrophosphokinase